MRSHHGRTKYSPMFSGSIIFLDTAIASRIWGRCHHFTRPQTRSTHEIHIRWETLGWGQFTVGRCHHRLEIVVPGRIFVQLCACVSVCLILISCSVPLSMEQQDFCHVRRQCSLEMGWWNVVDASWAWNELIRTCKWWPQGTSPITRCF